MDLSGYATQELHCKKCSQIFASEVWRIVDAKKRPDLMELIRQGALRTFLCPECGATVKVDGPLLLFFRESWPHLIFLPAPETDPEQSTDHSEKLISLLRKYMGQAWDDTWVSAGFINISHDSLFSLLDVIMAKEGTIDASRLPTQWKTSTHPDRVDGDNFVDTHRDNLTKEATPSFETKQGTYVTQDNQPIMQGDNNQSQRTYHSLDDNVPLSTGAQDHEQAILPASDGINDLITEICAAEAARDHEQTIILCRMAIAEISPDNMPELWGIVQSGLGTALLEYRTTDEAENIEAAIFHFEKAVEIYTSFGLREDWARSINGLGNAYRERIRGSKLRNIETAIEYYEKALQFLTRNQFPDEWGVIQSNLGNAFSDRIEGPKAENVERAIKHYEVALEVLHRGTHPEDWATAHANLSIAHRRRILGSPAQNLETAIEHNMTALQVYTCETTPEEWAMAQLSLGAQYIQRIDGSRSENVEMAIRYLERALAAIPQETNPRDWAAIQNNLGVAYRDRFLGNRSNNLEIAIKAHESSLTIQTKETFPVNWADTQNNLSEAYLHRIEGSQSENIEAAIHCRNLALSVFAKDEFPENWAETKNGLGNAYQTRIEGSKRENVETAIQHFEAALAVYSSDEFPKDWAMIQNNLMIAYQFRIDGSKAENLEIAVDCGEAARTVYTREAYPDEWAKVLNNLGAAYRSRIRGPLLENVEISLLLHRHALAVYTKSDFPKEWAETQTNLGNTYQERTRGSKSDNLEMAIIHYEAALEILTRSISPVEWASTANNLASTYSSRVQGSQTKNRETAISLLESVLETCTRSSKPEIWASTHTKLGNAYKVGTHNSSTDYFGKAILHYKMALEVYTQSAFPDHWAQTHYNIGMTYLAMPDLTADEYIGNSIEHFEIALKYCTVEKSPEVYLTVQSALADALLRVGRWNDALASFVAAMDAGDVLFETTASEAGKQAQMAKVSRLYGEAAWCWLQINEPEAAFQCLEKGQARLLQEAIVWADAELYDLPTRVWAAARKTGLALAEAESFARTDSSPNEDFFQTELSEHKTFVKKLAEKFPTFAKQMPDVSELMKSVPNGGALVAPLITRYGSAILVIPSGQRQIREADVIRLNNFVYSDLRGLLQGDDLNEDLNGWLGTYHRYKEALRHRAQNPMSAVGSQAHNENGLSDKKFFQAREKWFNTMDFTCETLWDRVMGPVHRRLIDLGLKKGAPIVIVPQGGLGLLPLHSAWRLVGEKRKYFLTDWEVSYAPGAYTLMMASQRLENLEKADGHDALVIADPRADLLFARREGIQIYNMLKPTGATLLQQNDATTDNVLTSLFGRRYIHFSCHGRFHSDEVLRSCLVMSDGELSMTDIFDQDISSCRLAVLSACESGMEHRQAPDEHLGFPVAFLRAGAIGVLTSLWSVNDASTEHLMQRFYDKHIGQGIAPAAALRLTQIEFCEDNEETPQTSRPDHASRELVLDSEPSFESNDHPDWTHPHFWAGFYFSGI